MRDAEAAARRTDWIYPPVRPIINTMHRTHTTRVRRSSHALPFATWIGAALLGGATAALAPMPSHAQTPEVAAWRVECSGDGKVLDCRAVQQLFRRDTQQLLVAVLARKAPDPKAGLITIQLPLGLNLTEPVQIKVDNGQPERQSIQTCTNVGCFVTLTASDKLLAAMRTGTELKITVQDSNKKAVEMGLPLLGFGIAFDKARS
jgi:invasion protein IalB